MKTDENGFICPESADEALALLNTLKKGQQMVLYNDSFNTGISMYNSRTLVSTANKLLDKGEIIIRTRRFGDPNSKDSYFEFIALKV